MCSCLCVFQGQSCGPGKLHPCSKWSCCCPEPPWEQPSCPERWTSRGKETMLMDPEPISGILSWGGKTPCMEYQDKHFIPTSFGVLYSIIGVNIDFLMFQLHYKAVCKSIKQRHLILHSDTRVFCACRLVQRSYPLPTGYIWWLTLSLASWAAAVGPKDKFSPGLFM